MTTWGVEGRGWGDQERKRWFDRLQAKAVKIVPQPVRPNAQQRPPAQRPTPAQQNDDFGEGPITDGMEDDDIPF